MCIYSLATPATWRNQYIPTSLPEISLIRVRSVRDISFCVSIYSRFLLQYLTLETVFSLDMNVCNLVNNQIGRYENIEPKTLRYYITIINN